MHIGPSKSTDGATPRSMRGIGTAVCRQVVVACLAMLAAGCGAPPAEQVPATAEDRAGEWVTLFDGSSVDAWRGFRRADFPVDGWQVDEGTLTPRVDGTVVDLVTRETFSDFEMELEWRVAPSGNSGIFVHVHEDHPEVWHTGVEFQVLDDERHPDGRTPETSAASIYGLVGPEDKRLRPAGEWNVVRIVVRGSHLQYTLNGRTVLAVDVRDESFRSRVRASGFAELPDFARRHDGHVALQHSSVSPLKAPVWFRHIRIRALR